MTFIVTFAMLAGLAYFGRGVVRCVARTNARDKAMAAGIADLAVRLQDPCCPAFAEHGAQATMAMALRRRWEEAHSPGCPQAEAVITRRGA